MAPSLRRRRHQEIGSTGEPNRNSKSKSKSKSKSIYFEIQKRERKPSLGTIRYDHDDATWARKAHNNNTREPWLHTHTPTASIGYNAQWLGSEVLNFIHKEYPLQAVPPWREVHEKPVRMMGVSQRPSHDALRPAESVGINRVPRQNTIETKMSSISIYL